VPRLRLTTAVLIVTVVTAAACSSDDAAPETTATATAPAPASTTATTAVEPTAVATTEVVETTAAATTEVATTAVATTAAATTELATTVPETTAAPTTVVETTSASVDLPAPGQLGPYGVGRTTAMLTDESRARPLTIDIWYPVAAGTQGAPSIYSFAPGIEFPSEVALADAPVSPEGPFPFVVYSHGSGGLRYVASFFTETLASHGFVVAAPDHAGNTATEILLGGATTFEVSAVNRPQDVTFVIDQLLAKSADPADLLNGAVDGSRVGVAGHSFGGYTALGGAGGITIAGTTVPADPRISAIVAMAPSTEQLSDVELKAVDVPTMLMVGTADRTTPVDPNVTRAWSLVTGTPRYRVELADAGHQSFTDVCDYQDGLPTLPNVPPFLIDAVDAYAAEGCTPELMPIDRAHQLTNTYAVAFFQAFIAGADGYSAFLAPEAIDGDDVTVELVD